MSDVAGSVRKRSVLIAGHPTSISLEAEFWEALKVLAGRRGCSVAALIAEVDRDRTGNLSSAVRVFVLRDLQKRLAGTDGVRGSGSGAG